MLNRKFLTFATTATLFAGVMINIVADGMPTHPGNVGDNIALNKSFTMSPSR